MNSVLNEISPSEPLSQGPKRLLVVSGGGARGAWGVGIANRLDQSGKRYAHVIGTSTGSLMAPLILLRKFEKLNQGYTSVSQSDIFNINPFREDGGIRLLNALFRIFKPSLGTTENLRDLVKKFITPDDYQQILTSAEGLDFTVAVVNFRTLEAHYESARRNPDYEQMVNWIWASANEPVFMSAYRTPSPTTGKEDIWFDGGVRNVIPIREGLRIASMDNTYQAVDVIVNSTPDADEPDSDWPDGKINLLKMVIRTLDTYGSGTREMNITIGKLLDRLIRTEVGDMAVVSNEVGAEAEPPITLTFYFMPKKLYNLAPNELLFDKDIMNTLFQAGLDGKYVPLPRSEASFEPMLESSSALGPKEGSYSFSVSRAAARQLVAEMK